ncbi:MULTISPECIES: amidohydrolase [unclassified Salinivibrio]|uniref:amidohydrolase n=1 Tax=unclassified Salinivibrio TaxID=2636825 RepID=UPI00128E5ED1|nr:MULTISPECIES: amidohydrolase [unclassified Salinivibrio]MPS31912.1 amidohydrolase [Salinivibrio sp. VYel7]MPX89719.1 amidohydrolase [Salinivibrio sp. VYel1]MPX93306.1 amidohydrolase [Salinivibrio sp. VYel9]MPX95867.1 amidohydrolase [Salinivibrio sp. VYel6]MPX99524.1 amidohydrolase [Salinivibrio sp. VYel4]
MANEFDPVTLRHTLHQTPELSNHEALTARTIAAQLRQFGFHPATDIGGHGILVTIQGAAPGPTTLLRADFDALPIEERGTQAYCSQHSGVMHACGHDGHTAALLAVAAELSHTPPARGTVLLAFQPAEETGEGAVRMCESPALTNAQIDNVYAFHNLPGFNQHQIVVRPGTFACASTGVAIELYGKTSHAAYPERGISPAGAMTGVMHTLTQLPDAYPEANSLVTLVHAQLGEPAYGVAPGHATVMATLRSDDNATFHAMKASLTATINAIAQHAGLEVSIAWHEPFIAAYNHPDHHAHVVDAAQTIGLSVQTLTEPMRWSEDVAEFLARWPGALFGIGSGEHHPQLHNPDYDFPDAILSTAHDLFCALVARHHGMAPPPATE